MSDEEKSAEQLLEECPAQDRGQELMEMFYPNYK